MVGIHDALDSFKYLISGVTINTNTQKELVFIRLVFMFFSVAFLPYPHYYPLFSIVSTYVMFHLIILNYYYMI